MTLQEQIEAAYKLIEEYDSTNKTEFTKDPDLKLKMRTVLNIIQFELSRIKKLPEYKELEVNAGDLIRFEDITKEHEIYQIDMVKGIDYEYKANGTIIKALENGTAEIEYFKYPTRIDNDTDLDFEFELSNDVLEIMPLGVAGTLLMSDVSNAYGNIYTQRYEKMKQELDIRYNTGSITIEGGI